MKYILVIAFILGFRYLWNRPAPLIVQKLIWGEQADLEDDVFLIAARKEIENEFPSLN